MSQPVPALAGSGAGERFFEVPIRTSCYAARLAAFSCPQKHWKALIFRGALIELTAKEFDFLEYFCRYPDKVLSREQILKSVWGYDYLGESNIIEVYVRALRLKLEAASEERLIHTVRGVGYVLRRIKMLNQQA
jgi:hypothetical protein